MLRSVCLLFVMRGRNGSLFRLAVRTSRCGRDNPGSNPGRDNFIAEVFFFGLVRN